MTLNKIFINNSDILNIGNNSNGKITLNGDIQTSDGSGLKINTVNGHIEIDGISETGKLSSFTISKTLASEGSVIINNDIYATTDITLEDLGDIEFGNNLRTENGADIDGYIKKTNSSKSKLTGDFLFKKKDKKEAPDTEDRPDVVNKEAIA